ncbi:MAG TPA: hypothetical protein VHB25_03490 [Gemmatimonadaceae bacterium]|nr:hypothetical protein [Gemmatimonadaceae bacterium]
MQHPVYAPTPRALADLVERCRQINRYSLELTAAEETRIAALASGILTMRHVLGLATIPPQRLPTRQGRIEHWSLVDEHLAEARTPAIERMHGVLVLDEHEQVKILSHRTWRGGWKSVTLWRDGVGGLSSSEMMEYLARLTALAQQRAPAAATTLLERSEAVEATHAFCGDAPRMRAD